MTCARACRLGVSRAHHSAFGEVPYGVKINGDRRENKQDARALKSAPAGWDAGRAGGPALLCGGAEGLSVGAVLARGPGAP